MNRLMALAIFAAATAFLYWDRTKPDPDRPLPAPPPVVEKPVEAKPVFSEAELAKVRLSLGDADAEVRWTAAQVLYNIRDPQAVRLLEKLLAEDPDPELRMKVVRLLRDRADQARLSAIVAGLRDADPQVRIASLNALGDIGDASVVNWVTALLKDAEPEVRITALKTIGRFHEKRVAEFQALAEKLKADYEKALRRAREKR